MVKMGVFGSKMVENGRFGVRNCQKWAFWRQKWSKMSKKALKTPKNGTQNTSIIAKIVQNTQKSPQNPPKFTIKPTKPRP
jgi:hypothetical protein